MAARARRGRADGGQLGWLGQCEGFRVDSPDGRIGFVVGVLAGAGRARPEVLAVRAGLFGRRLLLIPTRCVESVVPRRRRILLHASPELVGSERLGGSASGETGRRLD